jgi:anti-sigma factor RsiW
MIRTDNMLVAYVDGELDPETAHRVEALLASDAEASQRVEIFRETAMLLRAACDERFYDDKNFYGDDEFASVATRRAGSRRRHYGSAVVASFAAAVARLGGAKSGGRVSALRDR